MVKIDRILVPTDTSEGSLDALRYAHGLAERLRATVDLLHVWEYPHYLGADLRVPRSGGVAESLWQIAEREAAQALGTFAARAESLGLHFDQRLLQSGPPAPTIVDVAERQLYSLIVMGTHGRRAPARWVLGSVAERVVRQARCPVLTVRPSR